MDTKEKIMNMIKDLVRGDEEAARAAFHDVSIAKARSISGLGATTQEVEPNETQTQQTS